MANEIKKPEGLEGFSEETLNEMGMESIEGGDDVNPGCKNECTYNTAAGCGCYGG
ncbi:MAG: hypothetical protein LBE56_13965 [Tannerella sp.]|jgi:hypothetical protein|nr:hypothetical protein [Tannerella sp.]